MTIAKDLKQWRARLRITQKQAAEQLGVPYRTYDGWEQEWHAPSHPGIIRKLMAQVEQERKAS